MDDQQQQLLPEDYSYQGVPRGTYQNPSSDEDDDRRNQTHTQAQVPTSDDPEWEIDNKAYKAIVTKKKIQDTVVLYVGETAGMFGVRPSGGEVMQLFVEHALNWLLFHSFSRGSAIQLANQLKSLIVLGAVVDGKILKYSSDVIIPEKKKKKKKKLLNQEDDDLSLKPITPPLNEEDADQSFLIKLHYRLHLKAEPEKTFLSLFVPCTIFCLGWEPLLDKEYSLYYKLNMTRVRGKIDTKSPIPFDQLEKGVTVEKEGETDANGLPAPRSILDHIKDGIGRARDTISPPPQPPPDVRHDRREKRHHKHKYKKHYDSDSDRRHKHKHKHKKHDDSDSDSSDSSSSSSSSSDDESKHPKKSHPAPTIQITSPPPPAAETPVVRNK